MGRSLVSRSVPCRQLARGWGMLDRRGQDGQVCLSLASSPVPSQHTKILAWEDSSASKEVLDGARVELAGSLVGKEDRQAPGRQREARFQRPVRETPGDTAPCWA